MSNTDLTKRSLLANSLLVGGGVLGAVSLANASITTGASIKVIDTFNELALTSANIGDIAEIKGHTVMGIGGGTFIAASGTFISDGGTVINCSTGGTATYWQRMFDGAIHVKWFGAIGNGTADDTIAIQKALDSAASRMVDFSNGGYKVTGSGEACLYLTISKTLFSTKQRSAVIIATASSASTSILKISITDNGGLTDLRDFKMDSLTMLHTGSIGNHCVVIKNSMVMIGGEITGCSFQAAVGAANRDIYMDGNSAFFLVTKNNFGSGIVWGTPTNPQADGSKFKDNIFFGLNTGLTLQIVDGAYRTSVEGGTMVTRDGQIRIITGSQIYINNVQFEQDQSNGASLSPEKAHIAILGTGSLCKNIKISNCNLGGGSNLDYLIWIDNATDTDIDSNSMNAPNIADVRTSGNSGYTVPRLNNKITGGATGAMLRPDGRFRMVVTGAGYGTYNVLQSHSSLANGWTGGQFYKNENDEVVIESGFNGGINLANTLMATFPVGFRASGPLILIGPTSGTVATFDTTTTGTFVLRSTGSNASVAAQVRFPSKRN